MGTLRASGQLVASDNYVATWSINDVKASRAFGVTYTNTTGKTMFVFVGLAHTVMSALGNAFVNGLVGGVNRGFSKLYTADAQLLITATTMTLVVPPGSTYRLNSTVAEVGSTNTITEWTEAY